MKRSRTFKEGDKVFAKIKGYPAWPAVITSKTSKKFTVRFYGTGETGSLKPEDISYYLKNKDQLSKGSKKKEFKDAIEEIEKAIKIDGTDGDDGAQDEGPSAKRKRSSQKVSDSVHSRKGNNANVNSESEAESVTDSLQGTVPHISNTDPEELPFNPNVNIVSEQNLKHWIIYADIVKEQEELYKSMPIESRNYKENQVFPVKLPNGKYAGLKLHQVWPILQENEYESAMYDDEVASRLLLLKVSVATGKCTPENHPEEFLMNFNKSEEEIKRDAEMKLINMKYERVEKLRIESTLVELDAKIKNSLQIDKAEPKKALDYLSQMLALNIDGLMLKKHSHVVETIRRLRKYIGNVDEWNLAEEELAVFLADATKLRSRADEMYKKLRAAVDLPESCNNFWEGFNHLVQKFKDDCKQLSNREIFALTAEPYTRKAILERLEQEEELQEVDIHRPDESTEKVGESK